MGYRSEVGFVVRFKSKDDRDTFIELQRAKNDEYVTDALECLEIPDEDDYFGFHSEAIKWYDSFLWVKTLDALRHEAHELFDAAWRFIRIGEDYSDVEIEEQPADWDDGSLYEMLDIHRSLSVSFL